MPSRAATTLEPDSSSSASRDVADTLFPLPFTPFEFYYLVEDRPDYASAFPIHLECRGPLDRRAFGRAFRSTHARHPFLAAGIDYDRRGWPNWVAGEAPTILWQDEPNRSAPRRESVATSGGLQIRIRQDGDRTRWTFVFQHVAVDGMGAFLFISDLFVAYAHYCSGTTEPPTWRVLDPLRLRDRDGHNLFSGKVKFRDLMRLVRVTLPLNIRRAAVVSCHDQPIPDAVSDGSQTDDLVHLLTEDETTELSRVAGTLSVMLNDLLMRDYFLALAAWNSGTSEARRPIRVMVPTNLRRRVDYRMPAANVFSFAFLSRRLRDCENRVTLLATIRDEMATVKRQKRGVYFEAALRLFCLWPALLRWSLKRPWPFATAIFSNLGTGLDNIPLPECEGRRLCGDLVFHGGSGAAPIRPDTRVSVAIHTYAGRLAICVRSDPRQFTAEQQRALLESYVAQLRTTIASES